MASYPYDRVDSRVASLDALEAKEVLCRATMYSPRIKYLNIIIILYKVNTSDMRPVLAIPLPSKHLRGPLARQFPSESGRPQLHTRVIGQRTLH